MKSARWCWVVVTTMWLGCGTNPVEHAGPPPALAGGADGTDGTDGADPGADPGSVPDPGGAGCAITGAAGAVEAHVQLSARPYAAVLVSNAAGDVAYTVANDTLGFDDNGPIYAEGVVRLDADLHERFSYSHGSVVALDAAGDAFVAGSFTAPVDLGGGALVEPTGNIDVFVVKLSPAGAVLFARPLGLCGAGVESIAVARDGRIAVSGDAMGTAVLDAHGEVVRQLGPSGQLAFDAAGNLIIAGSFAGKLDLGPDHVLATADATDVDGFVAKLDREGRVVFGLQLGDAALPVQVGGFGVVETPRAQGIAGVAIGPHDEIAFTGTYRYEMDLFGVTLTTPPSFPSGQMSGTFFAELSPSGSVIHSQRLASINASRPVGGLLMTSPYSATGVARLPGTPIAVDAKGNILISANMPGNSQGPFAYPQLTKLDPMGDVVFSLGNGTGIAGYGTGVAVDGCGNVLWAEYRNEPSLNDAHTFLDKLAP